MGYAAGYAAANSYYRNNNYYNNNNLIFTPQNGGYPQTSQFDYITGAYAGSYQQQAAGMWPSQFDYIAPNVPMNIPPETFFFPGFF